MTPVLSLLYLYLHLQLGITEDHSPFIEVTQAAGINFTHINGASGKYHLPETLGAGGAFFDYDNDGDLDLFLVNSGLIDKLSLRQEPTREKDKSQLYHNNGDGTFSDATQSAKLNAIYGYNHGAIVADYDNDGDSDLYITSLGSNKLYQNQGDGTFTDVTKTAGVGGNAWSSSATFFDYDRDGYLDLFVVNYVYYSLEQTYSPCIQSGQQDYCNLTYYQGAPDQLYHNNGNGTFVDVTQAAGIRDQGGSFHGKGLGVVATDTNNDGWMDLYVANDGTPNYLFKNNGDSTFTEMAALAGCAYSRQGVAQAGMGVDVGDYDRDGFMDIFVTNFSEEANNLYRNNGDGTFSDAIYEVGLGDVTYLPLGFGTRLFDYDNDGSLDLFVANGHVITHIHLKSDLLTYGQRNQLFRSTSNGRFTEVLPTSESTFLSRAEVSRGVISADYDNDGDVDILVTQLNQPARLYRNQTSEQEEPNHWLRIKVVGRQSNRDGIGTKIRLQSGNLSLTKEIHSSSSYLSGHDQRPIFGLGGRQKVDHVILHWPSGAITRLENLTVNRQVEIVEGFD